jgi:uncharacterized protein
VNNHSASKPELQQLTKGPFAAGDAETVMNLFDDDIEWIEPGSSAVSGRTAAKAK